LFVLLHTFVHNAHDHDHNGSCGIYVLEQLYFSADVVALDLVFTLFIPFVFVQFVLTLTDAKVQKQFTIRAPPLA